MKAVIHIQCSKLRNNALIRHHKGLIGTQLSCQFNLLLIDVHCVDGCTHNLRQLNGVVALATDTDGNTSSFSLPVTVVNNSPVINVAAESDFTFTEGDAPIEIMRAEVKRAIGPAQY